jgi:transketolase
MTGDLRDDTQAVVAPSTSLDLLCINTVRTLAMDAVQRRIPATPARRWRWHPSPTSSGSGTCATTQRIPSGRAATVMCYRCGHACMLQYAALYLTGYDLTLMISSNSAVGSHTPGHTEYGHTLGVEVTTGPLGQGVANAVGMAPRRGSPGCDVQSPGSCRDRIHYTYFVCSDGDLMEGVSHEACSFAGTSNSEAHRNLRRQTTSRSTARRSSPSRTTPPNGSRATGGTCSAWRTATTWRLSMRDRRSAPRKPGGRRSSFCAQTYRIRQPHKQDTAAAHGCPAWRGREVS